MGVRGLQSYIQKCCKSAIPIQSVEELAERCRSSTDQELIVVVDGLNIVERVYFLFGYLPSIGGGQFNQYSFLIKLFVEAFKKIGIRLVFFFDGVTVKKKRTTWVQRRMDNMEYHFQLLDELKDGTLSLDSCLYVPPPAIFRQTKFILEEECNCEVFQSVFDCDEEIANYARRKGAFAVLGHDSDFVIFDIGRAIYLDSEHLDLDTMKTRVYYPKVLAQSLGLNKSQLPLLASLMGNDFIHDYELKRFHYKLCPKKSRDMKYLVPEIASYIKSFKSLDGHKLYGRVAEYVFGNASCRHGDIERSVLSYSNTFDLSEDGKYQSKDRKEQTDRSDGSGGHWRGGNSKREEKHKVKVNTTNQRKNSENNWQREKTKDLKDECWLQVVAEAQQHFRNNKLPDTIYGVMKNQLYESCSPMEDFRIVPRDLPIFAELTLELRQHLYGILLHQKPVKRDSHLVEEWCNAGPESLERASYVPAVTPSVDHPGLLALWGDEDWPKGRLSDIRWTLFVHSVSPNLDVGMVRQLPPPLVIPTLVLHHMVNYKGPGRLEDWEVEVFLATATLVHHYSDRELDALPDTLTYRGVRVANIIMLTSILFYDLLAACGYPLTKRETMPWTYFDGKLFQSKYLKAKESRLSHDQLCEDKVGSLKAFKLARSVIYSKSEDQKEPKCG